MIAEALLGGFGIEVTAAENGREALAKLAEALPGDGGLPFDLVLMDLQMPVMDGYEATKIILENPRYRGMPIFAVTAHAFDEEKERCRALGMKGHLSKPIDVEELRRALLEAAALTHVSSVAPCEYAI
jgi:CheY-like chemotaxis protein